MDFRYTSINEKLAILRDAPKNGQIFGAETHCFVVNPTVKEVHIREFETEHRVTLPDEYRTFLMRVGNGGAGPYYGLFPLGKMDSSFDLKRWREGDGFVGILSQPFPLVQAWNDLTDQPQEDDVLAGSPSTETEFDRQIKIWESKYWDTSRVNGAIPICHMGCAYRQWLIVTGPERGNIWCDDRASYGGLHPLKGDGGTRFSFLDWYCDWLKKACELLQNIR
jgi:hypothetical protein